jgi:hypothetical protein
MVFENRVPRRIFGPKRNEWEESGENCIMRSFITCTLCHIYIIRMIKSRRIRWAGNTANLGKKRNAYRILVGMPEGKKPL